MALYQLDSVGNRVGERKGPASMWPGLVTAAAFLLVPTSALSNDVVASFNRLDELQAVTDTVQPAKNAAFTWDEAGNLKSQQTSGRDRRFDWDIKQTLTQVTDNGVEAGRYDYGSTGLRVKRITALESVEYVLDGDEVLVEAAGAVPSHPATRRYTYASSALAVTDISGTSRVTRALHLDGLGSPVTETGTGAQVVQNRQYDAWGAYRNGTAPTEVQAKLGYTGHQYDVETGLTYARARYYDAEYGRFLSRDSVEGSLNDAPSLHRYAYVRANPLRYTDRSGRDGADHRGNLFSQAVMRECGPGSTSAQCSTFIDTGLKASALAAMGPAVAFVGPAAVGAGVVIGAGANAWVQVGRNVDSLRSSGTVQDTDYNSMFWSGVGGGAMSPIAAAPPLLQAGVAGFGSGLQLASSRANWNQGNKVTSVVEAAIATLPPATIAGPQLRPPSLPKWQGFSNEPLLEFVPVQAAPSRVTRPVEGVSGPTPVVLRVPEKLTSDPDFDDLPVDEIPVPEKRATPGREYTSKPAQPSKTSSGPLLGTNRETSGGAVTDRGSFRQATEWQMWDEAPVGPRGGRMCTVPGCEYEALVPPQSEVAKDWHGGHEPPWTTREFSPGTTRKKVLDTYQEDVCLQCPTHNLQRGNRPR